MARASLLAALATAGALASGCTQTVAPDPGLTADHNPSSYSVHQPIVQRTDFVLDLAAPDGLDPSEASRLQGWLQGLQLGYGDRVWVDQGPGYGSSRAREEVAAVVHSYGLLLNDLAPVTAGVVPPGAVRVVVSRMAASVPSCPDWSGARPGAQTSGTHSNYGCAVNSNLAAMIADPTDLVLGQTGSAGVDPAASMRAIRTYRNAVPTGFGPGSRDNPTPLPLSQPTAKTGGN